MSPRIPWPQRWSSPARLPVSRRTRFRSGKRLLEEAWHADERTGLELETRLQVELIGSDNQLEAIRANFEKRAPDFKDPK